MSRKIIKFALTTMGLAILISCITGEVNGVGRAAMVFSGTIFVYLGFFIKENKKSK